MRRGVIDQILMLMMVFVFLVTIFFLIIDYSSIGKVQNQFDMMTRQGSRLVSLGKDQEKVINMINALNIKYFQQIDENDISCLSIENDSSKVIFEVNGAFKSRFEALGDDGTVSVSSVSVAYNEYSGDEINCSVMLQKKED